MCIRAAPFNKIQFTDKDTESEKMMSFVQSKFHLLRRSPYFNADSNSYSCTIIYLHIYEIWWSHLWPQNHENSLWSSSNEDFLIDEMCCRWYFHIRHKITITVSTKLLLNKIWFDDILTIQADMHWNRNKRLCCRWQFDRKTV